jgi:hypothetical protein
MNKILNRKFTTALLTTASVLSVVYAIVQYMKPKKKSSLKIEPDTVLRILKDFRRDLFVAFKYLADLSNQVHNKLRSSPFHSHSSNFTDVLSSKLVDKDTVFSRMVRQVQLNIYQKYDIPDDEEFAYLCDELMKVDESIDFIIKDIKDQFKKSLIGVIDFPQIDIPNNIDIMHTFTTYHDLTVKSLEFLYKSYSSRSSFSKNIHSSSGLDHSQDTTYQELRFNLLSAQGFAICSEIHPELLLGIKVSHFSKENLFFKECVHRYDILEKEILGDLERKPMDSEMIQKKVIKFMTILAQFTKKINEPKTNDQLESL